MLLPPTEKFLIFCAAKPNMGLGRLIVGVARSHTIRRSEN